jgi:hypothetical protein
MRCDHCDAELVAISEGGVTGLALLPKLPTPYSHPGQRAASMVDGPELLYWRSRYIVQTAQRKRAFWRGLQLLAIGAAVVCVLVTWSGVRGLAAARDADVERFAICALGGICSLPLLAYLIAYFQGRARLVHEQMMNALRPSISPTSRR